MAKVSSSSSCFICSDTDFLDLYEHIFSAACGIKEREKKRHPQEFSPDLTKKRKRCLAGCGRAVGPDCVQAVEVITGEMCVTGISGCDVLL